MVQDDAHPTLADLLDQAVMGQLLASIQRYAGVPWLHRFIDGLSL